MNKKAVVIGAGISGLAAAYLLKQKGYDVVVVEKKNEPGGTIETACEEGFLYDYGPANALDTTPLITKFINELQLNDQFIFADKAAYKRYILRKNFLHQLPITPSAIIKSKLLSQKAKLRLLCEPLIGKSKDGYHQSLAEFSSRRLGKEFLDYVINPLAADVYAGNPESLSVKSAFPNLYSLEEKYKSIIWGTFKSIRERRKSSSKQKKSGKTFSFKDGMNVLPKALAAKIGEALLLQTEAKKIEKSEEGYLIQCTHKGENISIYSNVVISSIPAFIASDLFRSFGEGIAKHLSEIYYAPVLVHYLAYKKENVKRTLDGYGFLVPAKERKSIYSSIWNSVIFQNRSPEDMALFSIYIGGARNTEILSLDKELLFMKVRGEFENIMNITGEPVKSSYRFWPKAIPQYSIGHNDHELYFGYFEKKNPGIILTGSYRGGISIGDCIKSSEIAAEKAILLLQ
ncbi:MAG: protoporphyrinogen oxidase [Ignavibacteriaceae bacterium]|nr:protoporphyrinogen oxidase [Ignavibacteriaceae bacterium]